MGPRIAGLFATILLLCSSAVIAAPEEETIRAHILTIRSDPSVNAKRAASEALGEIGLPSLAPLMDYLHQVAGAKPGDAIWISPGYIRDALVAVCKRVGTPAEVILLDRFLHATNKTEREYLFYSLTGGSSYTKTLAHVLDAVQSAGVLDGNAQWAVQQIVNLHVYDGWGRGDGLGRDESAISQLLAVFAKYPELESRFVEIKRQITILKTVGVPKPETTFSPRMQHALAITVDEQTEFSIALPRPNGPWGYHWGLGERMGAGQWLSFEKHDLVYLGRTTTANKVYYRFIGTRALETPLDVYVQGGVPDDDPAEYPMTLTVRALPPGDKEKRVRDLEASLDDHKREYAQRMRSVEQDKSSGRGTPRR